MGDADHMHVPRRSARSHPRRECPDRVAPHRAPCGDQPVGSPASRIPFRDSTWYALVMTKQIAIRLPDDMVTFLDESVAAGNAPSRAALVARAVEREMRREAAERDAAILRTKGAGDDLDDLVVWTASHLEVED